MNDAKTRILQRISDIDAEDENTKTDRATVVLDQQSVGRLSRMDALQQQAMANATYRRRAQQRDQLLAALKRVETGEFGFCLECGDDIAPKRLDLNPAVTVCIICARG